MWSKGETSFREQSRRSHEDTGREPDSSPVQALPLRYANDKPLEASVHSEDRRPGYFWIVNSFYVLPFFFPPHCFSFRQFCLRRQRRRKCLGPASAFRFRVPRHWSGCTAVDAVALIILFKIRLIKKRIRLVQHRWSFLYTVVAASICSRSTRSTLCAQIYTRNNRKWELNKYYLNRIFIAKQLSTVLAANFFSLSYLFNYLLNHTVQCNLFATMIRGDKHRRIERVQS